MSDMEVDGQPKGEQRSSAEATPPPEMTEAEAEYHAKATTRPKDHIFVDGEEKAIQMFNVELDKSRQTRASVKAEKDQSAKGGPRTPPPFASEPEGSNADIPIVVHNIFSTPQILTFKIPKLPAMKDIFLVMDMGKLPTSLSVLPATFEPDADIIGPKASHLGNLAPSAASASLRLYMSDQYHQRAADYRWQEEMMAPSTKAVMATVEEPITGPVQSKLLGPKLAAVHKSFALPFSKDLGYTGDTTENLCNSPVIALQGITGNFYFVCYSSVALANVEILCKVNVPKLKEEDDIRHPWRISRMFTVNPFSHDAFVEWFNKNKTALTLGATSLTEPITGMNPLHVALGYVADPRIVRLMIKHCGKFIKLNATDKEGQSPIFKLLQRADIYHPSSRLYYRALELLKLLAIDAGCYLDLQDNQGNTLAHYAARHHRVGSQILPQLLSYGVQGDMKNNAGRAPVEEADYYGGNVDEVSKNVIPRKLPLDSREIKQLLVAAVESRRRLRNAEIEVISGPIASAEDMPPATTCLVPSASASNAPIGLEEPPVEPYPTSALLAMKAKREAKAAKEVPPAPGKEDAQVHMGLMRTIPEAEKRTIRTQWSMPRPLLAAGMDDEGHPRRFPTTLIEKPITAIEDQSASGTVTSPKQAVQEELFEPPTTDSAALFVPFPARVSVAQPSAGSTHQNSEDAIRDGIIASSMASALDQEVRVLNRRRKGESELQPSIIKKRGTSAKPKVSAVPSVRTYDSYVNAALARAAEPLSYKPAHETSKGAGTRLPPIDSLGQSQLLGTLLQKRKDVEGGRTLEECIAMEQTRKRNLANLRNQGSINIPSYAEVQAFSENRLALAKRTGKGLPIDDRDDAGRFEEDDQAFKNVNPDFATMGGFRGSFGLLPTKATIRGGAFANAEASMVAPEHGLEVSEGRAGRPITTADSAYQSRSATEVLNDATVIPLDKLLVLQKEFNELEKKEGRGYLTVGQVTELVKGFDSFGVPRSEREIEEVVRLGGLKRVYRHKLKANPTSLVPLDGITFNDYCAIMLSLNRL